MNWRAPTGSPSMSSISSTASMPTRTADRGAHANRYNLCAQMRTSPPGRPRVFAAIALNCRESAKRFSSSYPADQYVERHAVGNHTAENVFKLGRWVGSAEVEVGAAVSLWAVGRYVVSPATDGPRTNKMSHLGFDLIRAQILTEALVQGMKYSVRRDRPNGDCCAFPSGHAASAWPADGRSLVGMDAARTPCSPTRSMEGRWSRSCAWMANKRTNTTVGT